jgi:hypothetical protein
MLLAKRFGREREEQANPRADTPMGRWNATLVGRPRVERMPIPFGAALLRASTQIGETDADAKRRQRAIVAQ